MINCLFLTTLLPYVLYRHISDYLAFDLRLIKQRFLHPPCLHLVTTYERIGCHFPKYQAERSFDFTDRSPLAHKGFGSLWQDSRCWIHPHTCFHWASHTVTAAAGPLCSPQRTHSSIWNKASVVQGEWISIDWSAQRCLRGSKAEAQAINVPQDGCELRTSVDMIVTARPAPSSIQPTGSRPIL